MNGGKQAMEKRALLIVNPNSGDGIARNWVYDMVAILSKRYEIISVYLSKGVGDIMRVAGENADKNDAIICCGGDGTLNETLNGVIKSGYNIPIGYVPTGTTNDFATSHGIPKNIKAAVQKLVTATPRIYDAGFLGERAFTYVAAFGAFIDVCYKTPQSDKASFGRMAYIAEGAKRISDLKPYHLTLTAGNFSTAGDFIFGMVSNSSSIAGFRFFPSGNAEMLSDGKFEITLVSYPANMAELQQATRALFNPSVSSRLVTRLTVESAGFVFDGLKPEWTVDGEYGGTFSEVSANIAAGKMTVLE